MASLPLSHLQICISALMNLDSRGLHRTLTRASIDLTTIALVEKIVIPLIQKIGELWFEGGLRVANEHMASSVIRSFLGEILLSSEPPRNAPAVVITTPKGQFHELGALVLAVITPSVGWKPFYLGPNLPAQEIAAAVAQSHAQVVALSIVYPRDDPHLVQELRKLRRYLDESVMIIAGGRAAEAYSEVLKEIGANQLSDIPKFRKKLQALRLHHLAELVINDSVTNSNGGDD